MTTTFACGKIILFGEHAVVYGRPAIAVPVTQLGATATIEATRDARVQIYARDVAQKFFLDAAPNDDPIAAIIRLACARLNQPTQNFSVRVASAIPIARGLGSGTAVSVAIARALAAHFRVTLTREEISALAFEIEKLHHGTPSGIDNTVIAFQEPVYFVREQPIETFKIATPFLIAIADTGIASPTKIAVGDVRRAWEADRSRYESLFDQIGDLARQARALIELGQSSTLGGLMLKNQELLKMIGVSSTQIEILVDAAMGAGAEGAKLSGAGRGGNVIALVTQESKVAVTRAMKDAGAVRVIVTEVGSR